MLTLIFKLQGGLRSSVSFHNWKLRRGRPGITLMCEKKHVFGLPIMKKSKAKSVLW